METITFEAPGPGSWMLDTTHHGRRPVTGYFRETYRDVFVAGMPQMFARYGLPVVDVRQAYVEGCLYTRIIGAGEPEQPKGGPPPRPAMWLLTRLHPGLRRLNRVAREAWAERRWRSDVDQWFDVDRAATVAELTRLGANEPATLDDAGLLEHLAAVTATFRRTGELSFATHGGDMIPVGDYIAHCERWGIDAAESTALLAGASPASTETAELLAPVAAAMADTAVPPTSVDAVRALAAEADDAITRWLELHGQRLLVSDDLDSPTLAELPDVQLRTLLALDGRRAPAPDPGPLRDRVPADERAAFDEVLEEARYGLRLRDDNVGVRWNWPAGLIRRALLDVGRRLVDRGRAAEPADALELTPEEVGPALIDSDGPDAVELSRRAARRLAVEAAEPPPHLGPETEPPPVDVFPAALRRAAAAVLATIDSMQGEPGAPLCGVGVGSEAYRGRARVLIDAIEAIDRLEQGDVVVAPFTGPAWNSLLPLVGAFVVEEGGAMCHAAIVAREFGTPALIGVAGATDQIADGAEVEVDPSAGTVRLL